MAQHIGIVKTNEKGVIIEKFDLNFAEIVNALQQIDNFTSEYPWVSTVDPYGSTVFNSIHTPFVIRDLRKIKEKINNHEILNQVEVLIITLEQVKPHEYMTFIGD